MNRQDRKIKKKIAKPASVTPPTVSRKFASWFKGRQLNRVMAAYQRGGIAGVDELLLKADAKPKVIAKSFLALARQLQPSDPAEAAQAARRAHEAVPDPSVMKWLAFRLFEAGEIEEPARLLKSLPEGTVKSTSEKRRAGEIDALARLCHQKPKTKRAATPAYTPRLGALLYVAATTLPYHVNGYANRTHALLRALVKARVELTAMTRPGYPWDRKSNPSVPADGSTKLDGVCYRHFRSPGQNMPLDLYWVEAEKVIAKLAKRKQVAVIQAASNYVNAMPALLAARQLGVPFHYEMRGLWDLSRASKIPGYEDTERFRLAMDMEAHIARNADHIYVISRQLSEYIQTEWGIAKERISLLPNGVDVTHFPALTEGDPMTIGYAGSLVPYEGLDLLLEAIRTLRARGIAVRATIIGEGESRSALERKARQFGIADRVTFMGAHPPEKARKMLAQTGLICLPRKPYKVCELIPPLKLVEAMALAKPVIVPDLPVFCDEVKEGETGLFFKAGDAEDLARAIQSCLADVPAARKIGNAARAAVLRSRTWNSSAQDIAKRVGVFHPDVLKANFEATMEALKTDRSEENLRAAFWAACKVKEISQAIACADELLDLEKRNPGTVQKKYLDKIKSHSVVLLRPLPTKEAAAPTRPITAARTQMNSFAYETLLELARSLPVSDGCRYYKKIPLKVGIITDVFMYNFYKDVFKEVHYLSPDNYEDVFASKSLDIVLYVTCWKGNMNEEWRGIKFRKKPGKAFNAILDHARRQGMKLVFQSIEDPSNFEHFLPIAKQFDYIFTSDTETIERYKAECGHERVFHGEYGANPSLNNPIGSRRHTLNAAFFAGSWAGRYPERCQDMETIFDSILSSDGQLIIADRNYGSKTEDFCYPERFQGNIIPPIEHALLQSMHKLFRYNINFNSIKDSPTMCAMRVYEMQAMGVGIFSNYARSVFNKFPEIRIIPWQQDLEKAFVLPAEGDLGEYHRNMALVRNVLNDKTAHDIATRMVQAIGIKKVKLKKPVICVICDQDTTTVQANFERQVYDARVLVQASKINSPKKWKTFAKANGVAYFTWFTGKDEYEENYLDDLANAFKYTNARYVTRLAWFDGKVFHEGTQHDYMTCMGGKARTLFAAEEFSPQEFIKHTPHESINGLIGGYAVDPFELNYQRYLKRQGRKSVKPKPVLSVIVPVFNNGRFLRAKCIESLKRNQLWPRMEILLVDDGSTNPETIATVKDLAREHPNIRTYFYRSGASGSASRPRNKGIELATAPLISFLDPDNEISPGGYDTLCALFEETAGQQKGGVDFVSGYHVKVAGQVSKSIGKHSSQRLSIINDLKEGILMKGKFPVIPTQPAVIVRRLFDNPDFRFVEKSAGQDTLFGWELLCQAKNGAFTNAAYLTYFAERTDSVTNAIDSSYFEKKLILEKAQTAMLERNGLKATHLEHHYENFMRDWYLVKLAMVENKAERVRCRKILEEIARLYGKAINYEKAV